MLLKLLFFAAAALSLSTVVADPIAYNFILRCDIPEVENWCSQVYIWEEDSHSTHDPLMYSFVCTSQRAINFRMTTEPGSDEFLTEILGNGYHMNHIIYTTCTLHDDKIKSPRDKCKCHPTEGATYIHEPLGRTDFAHDIHFKAHTGWKLDQDKCAFPSAFADLEDWTYDDWDWEYAGVPKTLVAPCSWDLEREKNETHLLKWIRTPRSTFWLRTFWFIQND